MSGILLGVLAAGALLLGGCNGENVEVKKAADSAIQKLIENDFAYKVECKGYDNYVSLYIKADRFKFLEPEMQKEAAKAAFASCNKGRMPINQKDADLVFLVNGVGDDDDYSRIYSSAMDVDQETDRLKRF